MQTCAALDPSRPSARLCFCSQLFPYLLFLRPGCRLLKKKKKISFALLVYSVRGEVFLIVLHWTTLQPACGHQGPLGHPKTMPLLAEPHGVLLWLWPPQATLSMLWFDFSVNNLARLLLGFVRRRTCSWILCLDHSRFISAWHSMQAEKPTWPQVALGSPLKVVQAEMRWGQGEKCQKST